MKTDKMKKESRKLRKTEREYYYEDVAYYPLERARRDGWLPVSVPHAYGLCASDELGSRVIGGVICVNKAAVEEWLLDRVPADTYALYALCAEYAAEGAQTDDEMMRRVSGLALEVASGGREVLERMYIKRNYGIDVRDLR